MEVLRTQNMQSNLEKMKSVEGFANLTKRLPIQLKIIKIMW